MGSRGASGDEEGADRRSSARRLVGTAVGFLVPVLLTAVAAAMGYAFAVYPIWEHLGRVRRLETLGPLISPDEAFRKALLGVYFEDSGLEASSFGDVTWSVATVMTPFVGYAPAPGGWHNAHIDGHQFRTRRRLVTPKPEGVTRIFLTGASTAFSVGASSDARTIGGYLQSLLDERAGATGKRYEVFTFAAPAWSSTHERIAIENRLSELEPDLVLELTGTADCLYGQYGLDVLWARALFDGYYWELVNIARRRARARPMRDVQHVSSEPVPAGTVAARLEKNVRLAAGALSLAKARLHVFLQPSAFTTGKALSRREQALTPAPSNEAALRVVDPSYYRQCAGRIGERIGAADLPANAVFTNLSPVFDGLAETDEIFLDSFHFGDRGNRAIAQAMVDAIL